MLFLEVGMGIADDRVWNTESPNMAHWHIEYFKLKDFKKMAEAGRLLCPSISFPSLP